MYQAPYIYNIHTIKLSFGKITLYCICFMCAESLIEAAVSAGMIEVMKNYVIKFRTDEDIMLMVLLAVGSLADSGDCLAWLLVPL